jgi:polar amino acid transport system substrate-binding protein
MSPEIVAQLAPTGVLRAGINMSNFLLVTGEASDGDPDGVSPDMARAIAEKLGVECTLIPFKTPAEIADSAGKDVWDIGNIGAEPQRAAVMDFTAAYAEIEATYMVPAGSPIQSIGQVDREGIRIAHPPRSAYGLWLENNIKNAELVPAEGLAGAFELFVNEGLEALAGLRPGLIKDVEKLPGGRILDGQFSAVQQAVGVNKGNDVAYAFLKNFVEEAKVSGFVANLIEKHGVQGRLSVAPPA